MQNISPRIPAGLIAGAALVALVPIVGVGVWLWLQWAALPPLVQSTMRVLVFAVPLGAASAAAYVAITIAWRRWADPRMIEADRVIELTRAQQALPQALTNLSYSFHDSRKALPAEAEQVSAPQLAAPIPTFAQLLDGGQIGPGRPMLLGYDADSGQPLTGSWQSLYSCGVGGMTGSGKSWAVTFLAAQSAAMGARIILIDPHAGDDESLSNRLGGLARSFMCDVASSPQAIESALKLAQSKLENRKAGKGGSWPILLICDEWTSLLRGRVGELLTATALDVAEQGRKYGVFAILAAQAWQVDAAGAVRDRLASHYILRTRGDQFRYQTGLRSASAPQDTLTLPAGQAYMLTTRGDLARIVIPQMTPTDVARLGAAIDKPAASAPQLGFHVPSQIAPTEPIGTATGRQPDGNTVLPSTAAEPRKVISAEAAHAAGLFLGGKGIPDIVAELRNVSSTSGGRAYRVARDEIEQLIREGMQR